jgi:ribosomal protein S18 acetylase RimI-like enzyme
MLLWIEQWYLKVPAALNVFANVAPGARFPLFGPLSNVTVWVTLPVFVQVTVAPTLTDVSAGWKLLSTIETLDAPAAPPDDADAAEPGAAELGAAGLGVLALEHAANASEAASTNPVILMMRTVVHPPGGVCVRPHSTAIWASRVASDPWIRRRPDSGFLVPVSGTDPRRQIFVAARRDIVGPVAARSNVATGPPVRAASPRERLELSRNEGQVAALAGRRFIELDDAFLVHDPDIEQTWRTWLAGVRWPAEPDRFQRRLAESLTLFATLGRRPCLRVEPGADEPPDLTTRLAADGFRAQEASYRMRVDRGSAADMTVAAQPPDGVAVQLIGSLASGSVSGAEPARGSKPALRSRAGPEGDLAGSPGRDPASGAELLEQATAVMAGAFGVAPRRVDELLTSVAAAGSGVVLVRAGRVPVAAGRVSLVDGLAYLSAIGVGPGWRRRGLGRLVTAVLADRAFAAGARTVHLNVDAANAGAWRVYAGLGFAAVGSPWIRFVIARS